MNQLELLFATSSAERTILKERRAGYPYSVTAPINRAGTAELTLQSISGGLYGGETLSQRIEMSCHARAKLIQPTATTVRRANNIDPAHQTIALQAGPHSNLAYLARPLIMMPGAKLVQNWWITLYPQACITLFDGFLSHSPGDARPDWHFTSRLTACNALGRLLAAERINIRGTALKHFTAFGKFWCFGRSPPAALPRLPKAQIGASALPGNAGFTIALAALDGGTLCEAMEQISPLLVPPPVCRHAPHS